MKEELVSFKIAKEKGFEWSKDSHWICIDEQCQAMSYHPKTCMLIPTQSRLQQWLREEHEIFVTVTIPYEEFGKYSAEVWGKHEDGIKVLMVDGMTMYDNHKQAVEDGVEEALELIKTKRNETYTKRF